MDNYEKLREERRAKLDEELHRITERLKVAGVQ